jgi:lipopolysaccharide/colanic/teichoic acid biosynthesis glycosyltransferase
MDVSIALLVLLFLAPLFVVIGALVRTYLGKPVLFRQVRPGIGGRPFELIKFRSMTVAKGPDGELLPDEQRLSSFGKWIRMNSLDELPTLWNVVRGDMSLVGPRPLLMEYIPLYSDEQARRHEVLPGMTGWAQVNGRNALNWSEKFELDVWYVDNRSLLLDLRILFMTIAKVLRREGISQDGHATMEPFRGNEP